MASNRAYYWVALVTMVLGISSEYHRGGLQPLRNLVNRSESAVACVSTRANEYVSLARAFMGDAPAAPSPEFVTALRQERENVARLRQGFVERRGDFVRVRVQQQAEFARLAGEMARHQADFARLQADRARMIVDARNLAGRNTHNRVICKNGDLRISADANSDASDSDSDEISDTF